MVAVLTMSVLTCRSIIVKTQLMQERCRERAPRCELRVQKCTWLHVRGERKGTARGGVDGACAVWKSHIPKTRAGFSRRGPPYREGEQCPRATSSSPRTSRIRR